MDNCLLDISGDEPERLSLTEDFYTLNYLPFGYDPEAECPAWLKFLGEVFQVEGLSSSETRWDEESSDFVEVSECVPNEQAIAILQEFMGLLVTCQTKYQKMLAIIGPKRSGKGTIGSVIRSLVGPRNATAPTLTSLTKEHGLWSLANKTVAIIGDASISNRSGDVIRAVERLKSISGEDAQTINPKGGAYIDVDKLNVRFVLLANELQSLIDPTGALASRFVYLNTTQSFIDREDIDLGRRLAAETPGIFNWALAGLKRLRDRGHFEETEAGRRARDMAERLGSPIIAFVRECCEEDPEYWVKPAELYQGYVKWAAEANQGVKGRNRFYEDFERAFPKCQRVRERVWGAESNAVSVYKGVDLMSEYKAVC
jgi:putative DNA primase/helicase